MRCTLPISACVIAGSALIGASPALAQVRVTSLDELRQSLAPGDVVTVVQSDGRPVSGRLMRLGNADLDLRLEGKSRATWPAARDVTLAFDTIRSLDRPRDSARNGAVLGAGIGAAFGGTMFVHALAVDRNELDEWAGVYAGTTAMCIGVGALIGWAVDAAKAKPHLTFEASSERRMKVSVLPALSGRRGLTLTLSF